jgi:leucyl-tRNA synthetase
MSKSFGNVVNPDDIVGKYGADSLRLYEMFMGPFEQEISWSDSSLAGCYRFLARVWKLFQENIKNGETPIDLKRKLHKTIKKAGEGLEEMRFNTLVASLMEFSNDWEKSFLSKEDGEAFVKILAPLAPHISEEIWNNVLKNNFSVHWQNWPVFDEKILIEDKIILIIQINGKVRAKIEVDSGISENEAKEKAFVQEPIKKWLAGKEIKKTIFVKDKLINIIV